MKKFFKEAKGHLMTGIGYMLPLIIGASLVVAIPKLIGVAMGINSLDIYAEKDAKEHFITARIKAPGVKYGHKFRIDAYTTGQKEYLFNLGYREGAVKTCTLKFVGTGTLKYRDLAIYSQTMSSECT